MNWPLTVTRVSTLMTASEIQVTALTDATTQMTDSCVLPQWTQTGRRQGNTCVDINGCNTTSHGCSDECVNAEGSYHCQCSRGYRFEQDGRTCHDGNKCENPGHDCLKEMNKF